MLLWVQVCQKDSVACHDYYSCVQGLGLCVSQCVPQCLPQTAIEFPSSCIANLLQSSAVLLLNNLECFDQSLPDCFPLCPLS